MQKNIYYDKTELLSRASYFNMLIGQRGVGKTYGFKKWCIDDYIKTGKMFAWLRRYSTETKENISNFFKDIKDLYPDVKLTVKGNRNTGTFYYNEKPMGVYFTLSTSNTTKSVPYPEIDKIIFDEFLIVGNTYHYLNNEVVTLLELINTVFRTRDIDPNAKVQPRGVYLLGNNVTLANPYFLYFNLPIVHTRFYTDKTRSLTVEYTENEPYIDAIKNSKFGKLVADTPYYGYAIENKALNENSIFVKPTPANVSFYCAIDYKGQTFGFWFEPKNCNVYVNFKYDPSSHYHFALTKDDHSINTFLIKTIKSNPYLSQLIFLFRSGSMFFENELVKQQAFEMLSYFVR